MLTIEIVVQKVRRTRHGLNLVLGIAGTDVLVNLPVAEKDAEDAKSVKAGQKLTLTTK